MRRSKPLAIVAGAALFDPRRLWWGRDDEDNGPGADRTSASSREVAKDPEAQGPAPEIDGADVPGGTITVFLPGDPGPTDLDPTGGWSVTGNSIQQALTSRSLTQYVRDPETGQLVLVPDLATDLGTPNEDFTEWTFTIRDDATWENGQPVTAEEVAFGICRSHGLRHLPVRSRHRVLADLLRRCGRLQGPLHREGPEAATKWGGISVDGQDVTIKMAKPFPDMDYWGAFMAMGPAPLGNASKPPNYGQNILSNGPYKVESFRPNEELVLVKNDQWDPDSDPARHQYADKFVFKFNQDQAKVDQIMLSDNTESQTAAVDRRSARTTTSARNSRAGRPPGAAVLAVRRAT